MENLEVMVILFIIVILGYVACKLGYMGDKFDKKLSGMVVDITCPLLVLSSVMGDELPDPHAHPSPPGRRFSYLHPFAGIRFLGAASHHAQS